jgi:hypothetical protein
VEEQQPAKNGWRIEDIVFEHGAKLYSIHDRLIFFRFKENRKNGQEIHFLASDVKLGCSCVFRTKEVEKGTESFVRVTHPP